jgi:hypothetical protein
LATTRPHAARFKKFLQKRHKISGFPPSEKPKSSVYLTVERLVRGDGSVMSSVDVQERECSRKDGLGLSFLALHLSIGGFVLTGWLISSFEALIIYIVLLPLMALQWIINERSCLINNVETWLRTGRWRDSSVNPEEGHFLETMFNRFFALRPGPGAMDRLSYAAVVLLWLLGLGHLSAFFLA